jgi:hypothetical protein
MKAFAIPLNIRINEGRHSFNVSGEHCFLYLLYRFHSPSIRLALDAQKFGYDYSTLSKIMTATCNFIDEHHQHRLNSLHRIVHRFEEFNSRIVSSFQDREQGNVPVPPDMQRCSLFTDASRFRISRPSGHNAVQRAYYNGHKKTHNHAVQGTYGPDGIFYDCFDQLVGRHNDKRLMRDSQLNGLLRHLQQGRPQQFWTYCDKGYDWDTHVRSAAHHQDGITAVEGANNYLMSRVWLCFATLPLIGNHEELQVQLKDVPSIVRIAFLLTNAHVCLNQSLTGMYFKIVKLRR